MLLREYLDKPFSNLPKGIKNNKELVDMTMKSLRTEYPTNIHMTVYKVLATKQLIIHCKLPSRKRKGLYFDVVFQFPMGEVEDPSATPLREVPFKVFSNSPSFYFAMAKVFLDRDLFCEWLKGKLDPRIFESRPTNNSDAEIRYERTIYTIATWLTTSRFVGKTIGSLYFTARPMSYNGIAGHIQSEMAIKALYEIKKDTKAEAERKKAVAARKAARGTPTPIEVKKSEKTSKSKRVTYSTKIKHSSKVQKSKRVK